MGKEERKRTKNGQELDKRKKGKKRGGGRKKGEERKTRERKQESRGIYGKGGISRKKGKRMRQEKRG